MPARHDIQAGQVAAAFDTIAKEFEETLENDITRQLRERVYERIVSLIPPGTSILDINCGIGIDVVTLSERGYRASGIDISPGMIAQATERSRNSRAGKPEFFVGSFDDLSMFASKSFDLVLSNFGGLNCVPSLTRCASEIARVLRPGGYFVAVVMPKFSLWEILAGISRMNLRWGFRRFAGQAQATGFGGKTFLVYYHPLRALKRSCSGHFVFESAQGLNIISPPPHAITFSKSFPQLSLLLDSFDRSISSWPVIRSGGDHYVSVFRRKSDDDVR